MPVFIQDAQFYCDLTKPFFTELDKDVARHTVQMESYIKTKHAQLKNLVTVLEESMIFDKPERL